MGRVVQGSRRLLVFCVAVMLGGGLEIYGKTKNRSRIVIKKIIILSDFHPWHGVNNSASKNCWLTLKCNHYAVSLSSFLEKSLIRGKGLKNLWFIIFLWMNPDRPFYNFGALKSARYSMFLNNIRLNALLVLTLKNCEKASRDCQKRDELINLKYFMRVAIIFDVVLNNRSPTRAWIFFCQEWLGLCLAWCAIHYSSFKLEKADGMSRVKPDKLGRKSR